MRVHREDALNQKAGPIRSFGTFFANAAEAMLVLDADLRVYAANSAARTALALGPTGELGMDFVELLHEETRHPITSLFLAALNGTALARPTAVTCRRMDGAVFAAEVTAARFEVDDDLLLGVVVHDRTEADAAVEKLRVEQEMYGALFDLSPIALREEDFTGIASWFSVLRTRGVVDLDEYLKEQPGELLDAIAMIKTTSVNRAMLEMMGASSIEEMNQHRRAEMTDEVIASFRKEFVTFWNGGSQHEAEFVGLNLDGEPFECQLTLSARSIDGQLDLSRVIVSIQDVTKIKAYQRTLENLIAGKDRFVASISHELRTPLAAVLGLSEELYSSWDAFGEDEAKELMGLIARGASDLAILVEDLLLAAHIEVGNGVQSEPENFELTTEVDVAVRDCLASGEVAMLPTMHLSPVDCNADPSRVRQIIRNLVINAARYGGSSVDVVVEATPQPTVKILDDGPGIPATEWDRIFSPHTQVSGTEAARGALGLGLAISRNLAEVMGGHLSYEYRNNRSVFTLELPPAVAA